MTEPTKLQLYRTAQSMQRVHEGREGQRKNEMNINTIDNDTKIELENLVDRYGMTEMLSMLAEIAGEKVEHLRVNWQDEKTAKCWNRVGEAIIAAAAKSADYLG